MNYVIYQQQQWRGSDALENQHSTYLRSTENGLFKQPQNSSQKKNAMLTGEGLSRGVARIFSKVGEGGEGGVTRCFYHLLNVVCLKHGLQRGFTGTPEPPGYTPVKTSESLKCQLPSCEKNQNTECQSKYNKGMRLGWPVLRKLWDIETTPFKKFMTNLKWKSSLTYLAIQHPQWNPKAMETKCKCPSFAKRVLSSFPRDRWISKKQTHVRIAYLFF